MTNADYRLGVVVVENDVRGTTSGYNQTNYYANNAYGAMGGYESLPGTVPAAQMVYNHVARALLGGYDGQAGSISSTITDNVAQSYTFNYTVPSGYNASNMKAVILVIDQLTGEILNAKELPVINQNVGIETVEDIALNIFPNPASDKINISFDATGGDYSVQITDLTGRTVATGSYSNLNGTQTIEFNTSSLKTGNYLVSVAKSGSSFTKMIAIE